MKRPDEAPHPALSVYFQVDDVEATLKKAEAAGAKIIVPKMEIPDMERNVPRPGRDPGGVVPGEEV